MYILPRLVGIGTYILLCLVASYLVGKTNDKRERRRVVFVLLVLLSLMGLFFVPPAGQDLSRLFIRMEYYSGLSLDTFVKKLVEHPFPLEIIYYRIIGHFGVRGLLPGITAFIVFSICFYIYEDSVEHSTCPSKNAGVALFILLSRGFFCIAISNVRTLLAVSIASLCIYEEFCKDKRLLLYIPLYIVAALFHAIGWVFLLLRLIYHAVEREQRLYRKVLNLITVVGTVLVLYFLLGKYFILFQDKAEDYYSGAESGERFFYIWNFIITICYLIISLYIITNNAKARKLATKQPFLKARMSQGQNKLARFLFFIFIANTILCFVEYNSFYRLGFIFSILNGTLYLDAIEKYEACNAHAKSCILTHNVIILCSGILILESGRGNLTSLKFFE